MNLDPRVPEWGLRPAERGSVGRTVDSGVPWTGSRAGLRGAPGRPHARALFPSALSPVLLPVEMMAVFFLRAREPSILPVMGWLTACLLEQDCVCLSLSCVLTLCNSKEPTRLLCPWGFPRRE